MLYPAEGSQFCLASNQVKPPTLGGPYTVLGRYASLQRHDGVKNYIFDFILIITGVGNINMDDAVANMPKEPRSRTAGRPTDKIRHVNQEVRQGREWYCHVELDWGAKSVDCLSMTVSIFPEICAGSWVFSDRGVAKSRK
jgi:hypothetical protein